MKAVTILFSGVIAATIMGCDKAPQEAQTPALQLDELKGAPPEGGTPAQVLGGEYVSSATEVIVAEELYGATRAVAPQLRSEAYAALRAAEEDRDKARAAWMAARASNGEPTWERPGWFSRTRDWLGSWF